MVKKLHSMMERDSEFTNNVCSEGGQWWDSAKFRFLATARTLATGEQECVFCGAFLKEGSGWYGTDEYGRNPFHVSCFAQKWGTQRAVRAWTNSSRLYTARDLIEVFGAETLTAGKKTIKEFHRQPLGHWDVQSFVGLFVGDTLVCYMIGDGWEKAKKALKAIRAALNKELRELAL